MRRLLAAIAACALVAAFALALGMRATVAVAAGGGRSLPSPVIFPPQELPLSFSHARHLGREPLPCTRCHTKAMSSTRASDNLMPAQAACETCHAIGVTGAPAGRAVDGTCTVCHPGWDQKGSPPRLVVPPPAIKFSHAIHAQRGVACARCHGDLASEGVGLATRAQLPRMADCLECHDGKTAPARCTTCHLADPAGRVQTDLPGGPLVPSTGVMAHGADFARNHTIAARAAKADCESCHAQTFCQSCHQGGLGVITFHVGDYARAHAPEARRNSPDCASCHRVQTFCTGCHARVGVMPDKKTSLFPARREGAPSGSPQFHPPGYGREPGSLEIPRHALDARRNLATCASCHRETFCMSCHRSPPGTMLGASPHPAGWRGSTRCETLERKNPRVCLRCHVAGRTCDR